MTYFLILLPIAGIIIWLARKEGSRRAQTAKNEQQFLAAMRANPEARTSTLEARPEAPVLAITPGMRSNTELLPILVPTAEVAMPRSVAAIELGPSALPAADITPRAALLPLLAPRDGRCMVCAEAVDVRASDQSRWGVKIPEAGSERLVWVHFHCLAERLAEGQMMRGALASLVTALRPADGESALATPSVDDALQHARRLLES